MSYICHQHKFIYVRIPKTRSTSFVAGLKEAGLDLEAITPQIPSHYSAYDIRRIREKDWNRGYLRFSFIRNPWAWYWSMYHGGIRHAAREGHDTDPREMSFYTFVETKKHTQWDWLSGSHRTGACNPFERVVLVDRVFKCEDGNSVLEYFSLGKPVPDLHLNAREYTGYVKGFKTEDLGASVKVVKQLIAERCACEIEFGGYRYGED